MAATKPVLGGNEVVSIAVVQHSPAFMDKERSLARAEELIVTAGAEGAQVVVFPEAWLAGYPYWTEGWDSDGLTWAIERVRFHDMAVLAPSEDTERLGAAARRADAYVVMGCNELDTRPEVNTVYNSLLYFGPDGTLLGRHRKLMPTFAERQFWGVGSAEDLLVLDTDIGRLGGLICGENAMTLVRAAMIAQGEELHVAAFPGSFALHTGPRLQEPDPDGSSFWGHFHTRAYAFEAGAFVASACAVLDPGDVPEDFAHRDRMNIDYAQGGSQILSPLGVPIVPPTLGTEILHGECQAWMIKAAKAIADTMGHYSRPDLLELVVKDPGRGVDRRAVDALSRAAERHDVDPQVVLELAGSEDGGAAPGR